MIKNDQLRKNDRIIIYNEDKWFRKNVICFISHQCFYDMVEVEKVIIQNIWELCVWWPLLLYQWRNKKWSNQNTPPFLLHDDLRAIKGI